MARQGILEADYLFKADRLQIKSTTPQGITFLNKFYEKISAQHEWKEPKTGKGFPMIVEQSEAP